MPKGDYQKLSVNDIGISAQRNCTDIWAAILFAIFWVMMMILAGSAFHHGHLKELVYGTDYMGNICGQDDPTGVNPSMPGPPWASRKLLWYPIQYNDGFHIATDLKLGVCVAECPLPGFDVSTYSTARYSADHNIPSYYPVKYNSTSVVLGRCVPDFSSYDCTSQQCQQMAASGSNDQQFNSIVGIGGFLTSGVETLKHKLGVVVGLAVLTIVISFIWLFALRAIVKPLVLITCVGLLVAGIVAGAIMMHYSSAAVSGSDTAKMYLAFSIICWIITFLYLCALIFLRKDLISACDIIEESSKVPVEMPKIIIVPVVSALFIFLFAVFMGAIAVAIQTSGDLVPASVPAYGQTHNVEVVTFAAKNWRGISQFYNLFMFLWTMGFISAICHLVIALCAVMWYWSRPGDIKEPPSNSLSFAVGATFRYHLGTLALGSFLIALVQFLRIMMKLVEARLRKISDNSAVKVLICCANCCLSCFERLVSFLTKNAYVMTAMTGEPLFPAARQALNLLMSNRAAVAVNVLGEIILVVGKVLVTAIITIIAWAAVRSDGVSSNLMFIIVMGLTAYFISSVFATVFSVCIDAVVLSYCVDKEENNGADRPYYFTDALSRHVEEAHRRKESKSAAASPSGNSAPLSGYGHI